MWLSAIPPFAIAVGNPARVIRYRFDPPAVEALLKIRWWDWDDEQIREALPLLSSPDVDLFIAQYGHDLNRTKDSIE